MKCLFDTPLIRPASALALAVFAFAAPAHAQSDASYASRQLSEAMVAIPAASLELLAAGGELSVVALRPVGASVEVVLASAADGARIVLRIGREALAAAGVVVGVSLGVSAVAGGYLLWAGAAAVVFVADQHLAALIHRQELRP
jgi:hypothetical protein